jgi:poly(A) polymerase
VTAQSKVESDDVSLAMAQARAARRLLALGSVTSELGERFASAGFEIALVGGWVRDALLDRGDDDLDLTTSARPEQTVELLRGWADTIWTVGQAFGTIAARKGSHTIEITTYRTEQYGATSRKPEVAYGDTLEGDLRRRDFTVNAMAVRLPRPEFVDPYDGLADLTAGVLRTPGTPEESFSDDPLRMMRAARFAAQLAFTVNPDVVTAMTDMAERITIVSAERVRDELSRLLLAPYPRLGLELMVRTGLAEYVLPELPALQLEIDEHHRHKDVYQHSLTVLEQAIGMEDRIDDDGPDLVIRLAALLHDIGKPRTRRFEPGGGVSFHHHEVVGSRLARKRLTELRYPKHVVDDVAQLTELHLRFHGYAAGEWTDSAVRRYVRDAGDLLSRLHVLTRADSTTRNRRKAAALQHSYDELEARIAELAEQEELQRIRPDLDGNAIMAILDIPPGPLVGQAYRYLLELRMDDGPLDEQQARDALLAWWADKQGRAGLPR